MPHDNGHPFPADCFSSGRTGLRMAIPLSSSVFLRWPQFLGVGFYYVEKRAAEPFAPAGIFQDSSLQHGKCRRADEQLFRIFTFGVRPPFRAGRHGADPGGTGRRHAVSEPRVVCGGPGLRSDGQAGKGEDLFARGRAAHNAGVHVLMVRFSSRHHVDRLFRRPCTLAGGGMGFVSISTLADRSEQRRRRPPGGGHLVSPVHPDPGRNPRCRHLRQPDDGRVFRQARRTWPKRCEHLGLTASVSGQIRQNYENFFKPEVQSLLSPELRHLLNESLGQSVITVFWIALAAAGALPGAER